MTAHELEVVIRRPRPYMVMRQIKACYSSTERSRGEARPARCLPPRPNFLLTPCCFRAIKSQDGDGSEGVN